MGGLVLANIGYRTHSTDEGEQLQAGLKHAGWNLAGFGYGDGSTDVRAIVARERPRAVLVADVRDWHRDSGGCYDPRTHLDYYESLRDWLGYKVAILKDAGSAQYWHERFFAEVAPDSLLTYYHEISVRAAAPWLDPAKPLIRHYHTVDASDVLTIDLGLTRQRGIVTGALGSVYPLRTRVFEWADSLRIARRRHPGYGNRGCHTPAYLRLLAGYKVHVATASRFGFALRKIIESVAVGCTPITDLPAYDVLPEIDGALVRVSPDIGEAELQQVIDETERNWDLEERLEWSRRCLDFYDYRMAGKRLSDAIMAVAERRTA